MEYKYQIVLLGPIYSNSSIVPSYYDMDFSFPSSQSGEKSIQITIKHQSNCWSSLKTFSVWKVEIHPKIWYRFLVHTPKNDEELTFFYNKRKQLKYFEKLLNLKASLTKEANKYFKQCNGKTWTMPSFTSLQINICMQEKVKQKVLNEILLCEEA